MALSIVWVPMLVFSLDCPTFEYKDRRWRKLPSPPFSEGERVEATAVPSKPTMAYVKTKAGMVSIPFRCLKDVETSRASSPRPSASTSTAHVNVTSPVTRGKWGPYMRLAWLSWKETIQLQVTDGPTHTLRANQVGISPSVGVNRRLGRRFLADLGAGLVFSNSQVSPTTNEALVGLNYRSTDSSVWGVTFNPGIFYLLEGNGVEVGLSIPVMARVGNWPNPDGMEFLDRVNIGYGLVLESRLRRDKWFVAPQLGVYKNSSNFYWSIQFGKLL